MSRPSNLTTQILRGAAQDGGIEARAVPDEFSKTTSLRWAYVDGGVIEDACGYPLPTRSLCRFVREGWLLPGDDVGMFRPRTPADPAPPAAKREEEEVREQKPTPQQTAILRRVSTYKLVVAFVDGRRGYSYGDGTPIRREDAERLIRNRWVMPESPGLFPGEEPQSYVCRQP